VCLRVESAGSAESIILSAGSTESMILSVRTESMDTLSTSTESIILSVPLPTESMILSTLSAAQLCYYADSGGYKKNKNGDTDNCQLKILVNSASAAKGGQVLAHFKHIVSGALPPLSPMAAVF
jgi:hypothetical protein